MEHNEMELMREVAAIHESVKSAHKRIDENDRITEGIHELAANVKALAMQVKMSNEQMEAAVERIEAGQKSQGERIGRLEAEPANRWKDVVKQAVGIVVAAVVGGAVANVLPLG